MKKVLFSILVLSITTAISAQEILLNETPDDSLTPDDEDFQQFTGLVLHDVIEMAIMRDELITNERKE